MLQKGKKFLLVTSYSSCKPGDIMNEDVIGKCLRQVEYIRIHLWHRYS